MPPLEAHVIGLPVWQLLETLIPTAGPQYCTDIVCWLREVLIDLNKLGKIQTRDVVLSAALWWC